MERGIASPVLLLKSKRKKHVRMYPLPSLGLLMNAMGVSSRCLGHTSFRFMARVVHSFVSSSVRLHGLGGSLAGPNNFHSCRRTYIVRQVEPLPLRTSYSLSPVCPASETVVGKARYMKSSTTKRLSARVSLIAFDLTF